MCKKILNKDILIFAYFIFSIVGNLFVFIDYRIAKYFLTIGASSLFISFGVFSSNDYGAVLGIIAIIWCLIFIALFVTSFIKICQKIYQPFYILASIDIGITLVWIAYLIITQNWFSFKFFILDVVIGFAYMILLYILHKKEMQ